MFFKKNKTTNASEQHNVVRQTDITAEFLESVAEIHTKIREAESVDEVVSLTAQALVDPLINASYLSENPGDCLYQMLNINRSACQNEFAAYVQKSAMSDENKQIVLQNLDTYSDMVCKALDDVLLSRIQEISASRIDRDVIVANWLTDIRNQIVNNKTSTKIKDKETFLRTVNGMRRYYKGQYAILRNMHNHVRNLSDVENWYSRYLLVPAIANAKDGLLFNLEIICSLSNDELVEDCSRLADELGVTPTRKINPLQLRRSIQQLCKARTGFFNPESFLYSIKPDALII